jgi:hypothetical protein
MKALSKRATITIALPALIMLGGCTLNSTMNNDYVEDDSTVNTNTTTTLAKVFDVSVNENTIRFLTMSNGCTSENNFSLTAAMVSTDGADATQVSINLRKADYCKAMPRLVAIELPITFERVGPISITNPALSAPKTMKPKGTGRM